MKIYAHVTGDIVENEPSKDQLDNDIMTTRLNIRHETFFNSFVSFVADKEVLIWILIEICLGYHREVPTFKSSNSELHVLNR